MSGTEQSPQLCIGAMVVGYQDVARDRAALLAIMDAALIVCYFWGDLLDVHCE